MERVLNSLLPHSHVGLFGVLCFLVYIILCIIRGVTMFRKEKAIKKLEQLISGYLYNFFLRSLPDKEMCNLKERTIGAIQYAYYVGVLDSEKFDYYIDRVYLEENKPL